MSYLPLLALLSIGGWPTTFPAFKIALAFDERLPASVTRQAAEEAAALWAPYGVAIARLSPAFDPLGIDGRAADAALAVLVAPPDADAGRAWSSPFGSIRFLSETDPESTILLHYDVMIGKGLSTVSLGGAREAQWPRQLRDQVLGRMIGRVVAHEIGHWLLRSREHSTAGMMRAHQTTDELADPGRAGFALMRADVARLRGALTR